MRRFSPATTRFLPEGIYAFEERKRKQDCAKARASTRTRLQTGREEQDQLRGVDQLRGGLYTYPGTSGHLDMSARTVKPMLG